MNFLDEYFKNRVVVLDGGFGTQLEAILKNSTWGAAVYHTSPETVLKIHKSYLEHGADIITTGTFEALISEFQKHLGVSAKKSKELLKLSVQLAKKARDEYSKESGRDKILIAGSIGTYATIAASVPGSYDKISVEEFIELHRPQVQCLVEAGVDLLAFETIYSKKEPEALMKLLAQFPGTKAWISFCDSYTEEENSRECIKSAAQICLKHAPANQLVAIGVNCCPPEKIESMLKDIASVCPGIPLIAYPNSGETLDFETGWHGTKDTITEAYLKSWVNASTRIIGGCCRTTPEDIAKIWEFAHKKENAI